MARLKPVIVKVAEIKTPTLGLQRNVTWTALWMLLLNFGWPQGLTVQEGKEKGVTSTYSLIRMLLFVLVI
jgi:hypothetical protein